MWLGTDSCSADENDYVNSACRKKKKNDLLRDMQWVNWVLAMLLWWLIKILFTATLHFISIEISDNAQKNDKLYTFSNIFNQGINLLFGSRNKCKPSNICVSFFLLLLQIICQLIVKTLSLNGFIKKT